MSLALLLDGMLRADVAAGFETFGISAPGPFVAQVEALGVRHVPIRSFTRAWDPRADVAAARELFGVLRRLRPDVLHTHTPKAGVLGRLLGRAARVPVVVNHCHGLWTRPEDGRLRRALVYTVEALAAHCSDVELYVNDQDRRTLRPVVPEHRSLTVGGGIDLDRFRPDPDAARGVRAELGVAPATPLVGGVGRRVAEKGVREFAVAARALAGSAEFVWVGPADEAKSDHLAADEEGVRFLGMRHDMPAVYSALDVFVLPSYREGLSQSAMEAAACGCAPVLSDIRGCREVGEHGRELLLVPPGDGVALTAAVGRLLDDPGLRARLGAAARARALSTFDQRRVAQTALDTYAAVAAKKGLDW
ncbi:MAG: glycosyltransferase [Egibacteraceae bacterium]